MGEGRPGVAYRETGPGGGERAVWRPEGVMTDARPGSGAGPNWDEGGGDEDMVDPGDMGWFTRAAICAFQALKKMYCPSGTCNERNCGFSRTLRSIVKLALVKYVANTMSAPATTFDCDRSLMCHL